MSPCITCGSPERYSNGRCAPCQRSRSRRRNKEARSQVLNALGAECVECGFTDTRALQIDHVNGGGNHERRKKGNGHHYYQHMLRDLTLYQVLCANCNWIKRHELREYAD